MAQELQLSQAETRLAQAGGRSRVQAQRRQQSRERPPFTLLHHLQPH